MALKEYDDMGTRTVKLAVTTTNTEAWWRTAAARRVYVKAVVTNAAVPGADGDLTVEPLADNDVVFAGCIIDTAGTGSNFVGTLVYRAAAMRASDGTTAGNPTAIVGADIGDAVRGAANGYLKKDTTAIPKNQGGPCVVGGRNFRDYVVAFSCVVPITA